MARSPKSESDEPSFDPAPVEDTPPADPGERTEPDVTEQPPPPEPPQEGDKLPNPAQPLAETVIAARPSAAAFITPNVSPPGYPKTLFHPVHGGIEIADPGEEAGLSPRRDWFDTPEQADAARTWTEAHMAGAHNTRAKLAVLDEQNRSVVRNSASADEAIRSGNAQPL